MKVKFKTAMILVFLISFNLQAEYADSISKSLKKLPGKERASAFLNLANYYKHSNPRRSIIFSEQAIKSAQEFKLLPKQAYGYMYLSEAVAVLGQYNLAISHLQAAKKIFDSVGYKSQSLRTLKLISQNFRTIGVLDKALEYNLQGLKICTALTDSLAMADFYTEAGNIQSDLKQFVQADEYFSNAVSIYEAKRRNDLKAEVYTAFASSNFKKGNYPKALSLLEDALSFADKNDYLKISIYCYLGQVKFAMGYLDEALEAFTVSHRYAFATGSVEGQADAMIGIARTQLQRNRVAEALSATIEAATSYEITKNIDKLAIAYWIMSEAYARSGNFAQAYKSRLVYEEYSDSLRNNNQREKLFHLQVQSDLNNANDKLAAMNNESMLRDASIRQTNIILWAVGVSALLMLTVIIVLYKNYHNNKRVNLELKMLNEELAVKNERLLKSEVELKESNAIKDKFYSIIAHDIRNPLNPIGIGIDILKERDKMNLSKEKIDSTVENLGLAVKVLRELLENLLQWTNFQKGRMPISPEEFDLYEVIKANLILLEQNYKQKGLIILFDVEQNSYVVADRNMASTVVRNLLSNAVKFTPIGGIIKITSRRIPGFMEVSIIDTGLGMSEEVVENLFRLDHFHTTEGTQYEKGSGLGLKLCKEFIDKHNCIISCKSQENKGSTFRFTLPVKLEE